MVSSFGGEILAASTETALTDITFFFFARSKMVGSNAWSISTLSFQG